MSELVSTKSWSREGAEESLPALRDLDRVIRRDDQGAKSSLILAISDPRAYYVSRALESFDREFRRTIASARAGQLRISEALEEAIADAYTEDAEEYEPALVPSSREGRAPRFTRVSRHGVRPDLPSTSSLQVVASEPGSSLVLLEILGAAISVMSSDPMTALVNAAAWSGPVRRVRAFLSRREDPLEGVSARQALVVLSEFGGDPAEIFGDPDQVVDVGGPLVRMPDGMIIRGRRKIHLVHQYADGAVTWVEIE